MRFWPAIISSIFAATLLVTATAEAQQSGAERVPIPEKIAADVFGAPPEMLDPKISPDGQRLVYAQRAEGKQFITVIPLSGGSKTQTEIPADNVLNWFRWAGNNRVLTSFNGPANFYGEQAWTSFVVSLDVNTQQLTRLGKTGQGLIGDDVIFIDPAGSYILLSVSARAVGEPKVYRIDLATNDHSEVVNDRPFVRSWSADRAGNVRLGVGYAEDKDLVFYRGAGQKDWKKTPPIQGASGGGQDVLVSPGENVSTSDDGYAIIARTNSRAVLSTYNYATSAVGQTLFEVPKYDIASLELNQQGTAVESVRYQDTKLQTKWFDPGMAKIQKAMEQSLPGQNVTIDTRSLDNSRMIVSANSPSDPGSYYLYEPKKARLHRLGGVNDKVDPEVMAPTQAIEYQARDGLGISGYLTLPKGREPSKLPLIVLPHDKPMESRTGWDFNNMAQLLANRGYAVLQPNYRGSSGYGDEFAQRGKGEIGRKMQDDLDDGVEWLAKQGLIDASRVCIVGKGYGGYAAVWGIMRNPEKYRCAAAFAPVATINGWLQKEPDWLNDRFNRGLRFVTRMVDPIYEKRFDEVSPAKSGLKLTRPLFVAYRKEDLAERTHFDLLADVAKRSGQSLESHVFRDKDVLGLARYDNDLSWLQKVEGFLAKHNPADMNPTVSAATPPAPAPKAP